MTLNLFRTILTVVAMTLPVLSVFFGCTTDAATGANDCSATWIGPQFGALVSGGLLLLNLVCKAFGQGGTVGENLANKTVVVTPDAKAGTVTQSQVNSLGPR